MKYIVIEGIIGAGKTTLAKQVAKATKARLLLEEFTDNPYLEEFYKDPAGKAFHLETSFLAARRRQMVKEIDKDSPLLITDYHFQKTLIFAKENLTKAEFKVFSDFHELASTGIPEPDIIVFIDTSPETAIKNIRARGRSYETSISVDYLKRLHKAYKGFLKTLPADKVILLPAVNAEEPEFPFTLPHIASIITGK